MRVQGHIRSGFAVLIIAAAGGCGDDGIHHLAPDTALDDVPALVSNQGHVRILFHANGNANGFACQLDAGGPTPCISPFEADVADGPHTFAVAASLNTSIDDTPATLAWRVDTAPPDTTLVNAPAALDNTVTPERTFTGIDASGDPVTFECALDGDPFLPCTSPDTLLVLDGIHTFEVRAVDTAGNVDPTPAHHGWTIDTTAPDTAITAGPATATTTQASVSFSFSSPDATATFECALDAGAFAACTSPRALTLADGSHTFVVRAKDTSMIVDPTPASRTWTVDGTAPPVTITSKPPDPSNDATPTFGFSSTDSTATFECQIDGAVVFAPCTSPWTSPTIPDGSNTFRVRASDPVGNQTTATFTWVVDTIAPTVTITGGPTGSVATASASFPFTTTGSPTSITCSLDGAAPTACSSPKAFTNLPDGLHTLVVQVADLAGNTGMDMRMWTSDITPPVVMITSAPTNPTADNTPTFVFTVVGATSVDCKVDALAFAPCTSPFTTAVLSDASHTVTVRGTDGVGNTGTDLRTFTVDTTPPVITITSAPPALTNDNTPTVTFTVTGQSGNVMCQVDALAAVVCNAGTFTSAALLDGPHSIKISAADALGNPAMQSASFTIDTVAPTVMFTDTPPASWPVNYFDIKFASGDATATFECSLDGGAFAACTSGSTVTTTYNTLSTFAVRAKDAATNTSLPITTSWTSSDGLVLHYPWEQGATHNTSLLAQVPAYSPDGTATLPVVGGWAGTAAGAPPAHTYPRTIRPLSSGNGDSYTASVWVRPTAAASGVIWSNAATNGLTMRVAGANLTVEVFENGTIVGTIPATLAIDRWSNIAVRTTGVAKGLVMFVNGAQVGSLTPAQAYGFGAGQAPDLTVGALAGADVDDLRFYNRALTATEMCTVVMRGEVNTAGICVPLLPGLELDFEGSRIVNSGINPMAIQQPQGGFSFAAGKLGLALKLAAGGAPTFKVNNFQAYAAAQPGHSVSFWFDSSASAGTFGNLFDCMLSSAASGQKTGLTVAFPDVNTFRVVVGNGLTANGFTQTIALPNGRYSVVVVEKRSANATQSIDVYLNGTLSFSMPIGAGNVFASANDVISLGAGVGMVVDEYEVWPRDLSLDPEMLCENGFDGEWDHLNATCQLTSQ